jgi:signal transduction histidine kinase
VALLLGLLFYARRANQAEHKSLRLKLLGDFMQSFDQEKEQFQKDERKRISKTLHDKVSSQLAAIKWLFESKVDDLEQNKLESGGLNSIMKMIEDAYSETRKISREIETEGPTTRIFALRKKLANIQDNDRLKLDVQIEGFAGKFIQYHIEDHISAIVMEMMANTFKYAKNASQLKIRILRKEDAIQLHVSDDGTGFNMEEKRNGHGVRNIHDRIEAMNGQIQFDAKKGEGVRLDALIPLE